MTTEGINELITEKGLSSLGFASSSDFSDLDSDRTLFLSGDSSSFSVNIIPEEEYISNETLRFTETEITNTKYQYYYGADSSNLNYMIFDSTSGLVGFVEGTEEVDGCGYELTDYGRLKIDADDGIYYIEKTAVNGNIWTTDFWALGDEDNKTVHDNISNSDIKYFFDRFKRKILL